MRLSVRLWCGAVFFLEKMNEMVRVFKACLQRDLMNLFVSGEKQVFRGLHPLFVHVFDGRQPESGGKLMADPVFAHMTVPLQILKFQGPVQMIVHIVFQLPQIGGVFFLSVFRGRRIEGFGKKLCQDGGYQTGIPQFVWQGRAGFTGKKLFQVPEYGGMPLHLRKQAGVKGKK